MSVDSEKNSMNILVFVVLVIFVDIQLVYSLKKFILLHTGDLRARYDETGPFGNNCYKLLKAKKKCVGGFPRLQYAVNYFRQLANEKKGPPVHLFLTGNIVIGTAWDTIHRFDIAASVINSLEPTAMTLGMTEFDRGTELLSNAVTKFKVPIITTNIDISKLNTNSTLLSEYIFYVHSIKVGVIGLLSSQTRDNSNSGDLLISDEYASVTYQCDLYKEQGVQMIIVLCSFGEFKLLKQISGIAGVDIVIAGKNKGFMYTGEPPAEEKPKYPYPFYVKGNIKRVPIVTTHYHGKYLGCLEVTLDEAGRVLHAVGNPIYLSSEVPKDQKAVNLLQKYRGKVEKFANQQIGSASVLLQGSEDVCGWKECNTGNLIADAFVFYTTGMSFQSRWSSSPIALVHAGSVNTELDLKDAENILTTGDLVMILPYNNVITMLTVNGAGLKSILEASVRGLNEGRKAGFLQVSGIKVRYDMKRKRGDRIVSLKLRCGHCPVPKYEDMKLRKLYNIIMPNYIVQGHEGYSEVMFELKNFFRTDLEKQDLEMVTWYTKKQSPLHPEIEGRISFVEHDLVTVSQATAHSRIDFSCILVPLVCFYI